MRYTPIQKEIYIQNRRNLAKKLKSKSLAVFNSNDIMPTNADGTMAFRQNNDIFYLTGIDQEETVLLLFPECPQERYREVLFVRETNEEIAIWEGHKLTKEEATEVSGVETVFWLSDFKKIFHLLMGKCEEVYLNSNEHTRAVVEVETRDARFIKWCKEAFPLHSYNRITPQMHDLRAVKSPAEIAQIQTACDITEEGFRRVLKFVKPGVMEYEIEAEYVHEFVRRGSRGFAYTPIVASGFNSCVLHYIENDQPCKEGDLLLMDVGAEYGNYNADMTRTIPVSGRFTPRQKEVYNAVLRIMKEAKKILKTGILIDDYHVQIGEIVTKELIDLKLITTTEVKNQNPAWPAYKKYMMHGTSHHLGLDVHDVGNWDNEVAPGMVFTIEPGIYIREENFGIRLENDVVVTPGGNDDLMKNIPIEAEEIEELMNSKVGVM
ncbi:aminopeptidase P family protein [uncultured Microscilla sp.]|uniref:aminopeptidase P family protein n=1 Tax=uncultured Microscilla sp. TaxID=432653 RepID=UPI00261C0368|nr:aminopeptidase P family protein [uncultured Microscilla sp.]